MTGTIKRLSDRGFGFIRPDGDDARGEHFFHAKEVTNANFATLQVGERVEFDSKMESKGLAAINVRVEAAR